MALGERSCFIQSANPAISVGRPWIGPRSLSKSLNLNCSVWMACRTPQRPRTLGGYCLVTDRSDTELIPSLVEFGERLGVDLARHCHPAHPDGAPEQPRRDGEVDASAGDPS